MVCIHVSTSLRIYDGLIISVSDAIGISIGLCIHISTGLRIHDGLRISDSVAIGFRIGGLYTYPFKS